MREIKFRAWTNDTYINSGMLYDYQDTHHVKIFGFDSKELPVMQYTGLTDRNGTPIYEGDIVKGGRLLCSDGTSIQTDKTTVKFVDGMFKAGSISLISISRNTEVIGNIFENSDLLGGDKE